ncbi:MAG: hypothetical protein HEP71_00640 [Roseivirga sp.]|nr:hypothetical protein [Roseivirga sp.]
MEEFRTSNQLDLRQLYQQLNQRKVRFVIPPASLQNGNNGNTQEQFNLGENDEQAGSALTNYYPGGVEVDQESVKEVLDDDFNLKSYLGTPLVMPVMLEDYQLPNEPIITVTGNKKIVKTALTGVNREGEVQRRGSVKELISVNDYTIKITGVIVNEQNFGEYPRNEVVQLRNLYEARKALKIRSLITDVFGITHIAISNISVPGQPGMHNNQRYEITGFSDEDFRTDLLSQL